MDGILRTIDANLNRAAEGTRVLEDLARYGYDNQPIAAKLKKLRHDIRKTLAEYSPQCLAERDAANDVGLAISKQLTIDGKTSLTELATANFKRLQEALRVIEENLKLRGEPERSKLYEQYRFAAYDLEKEFCGEFGVQSKRRRLDTDLYCLTAAEHSGGRGNLEVVRQLIDSGIKIIQYREKDKQQREKYEECLKIRELTAAAGVTFIVNDDIAIALLVKADGVHIGQDDLPVAKVRELVGAQMIIGVSTHSPAQAQAAVANGADYIGVGPIYQTFTKKDVCDPVGLTYLEWVANHIDLPFVAIGGIKAHNIRTVKAHGAQCIALVTEIVGAADIPWQIQALRAELNK